MATRTRIPTMTPLEQEEKVLTLLLTLRSALGPHECWVQCHTLSLGGGGFISPTLRRLLRKGLAEARTTPGLQRSRPTLQYRISRKGRNFLLADTTKD